MLLRTPPDALAPQNGNQPRPVQPVTRHAESDVAFAVTIPVLHLAVLATAIHRKESNHHVVIERVTIHRSKVDVPFSVYVVVVDLDQLVWLVRPAGKSPIIMSS